MESVNITTDFIKLDQFLKFSGVTYSGAEAKELIYGGLVKVNGQVEVQRGKKLRKGDTVEINNKTFVLE